MLQQTVMGMVDRQVVRRTCLRKPITITTQCFLCKKDVEFKKLAKHNSTITHNPSHKIYCRDCGKLVTEETRAKISAGHKGHHRPTKSGWHHTEETKEKLRKIKTGKPCKKDSEIVDREIAIQGYSKFATTNGIIPDAVIVKDGKLIALEVEKERYEVGVREKMQNYAKKPNHGYDEVILVWYTPDNIRQKVWLLKNGEWTLEQ
jgi:hypothetical protein